VISDGGRFDERRKYQRGVGVATALLVRHGVPVVSTRDYRTIETLWGRLQPERAAQPALDHHECDWYVHYFGTANDPEDTGE